jgi:hypothetical protein
MAGPIADAFVVKHERAAVAHWPCRIKTVVLMHRDVITARNFASPVIILANAIRVGRVQRLNQVLAHQVPAVIGAAEALELTVFQGDRLKPPKNLLAQPSPGRTVHQIANHDGAGCCERDDDERDADGTSFDEWV